jgi:hypothetical protein
VLEEEVEIVRVVVGMVDAEHSYIISVELSNEMDKLCYQR